MNSFVDTCVVGLILPLIPKLWMVNKNYTWSVFNYTRAKGSRTKSVFFANIFSIGVSYGHNFFNDAKN